MNTYLKLVSSRHGWEYSIHNRDGQLWIWDDHMARVKFEKQVIFTPEEKLRISEFMGWIMKDEGWIREDPYMLAADFVGPGGFPDFFTKEAADLACQMMNEDLNEGASNHFVEYVGPSALGFEYWSVD